jgi:hypothetical protein
VVIESVLMDVGRQSERLHKERAVLSLPFTEALDEV